MVIFNSYVKLPEGIYGGVNIQCPSKKQRLVILPGISRRIFTISQQRHNKGINQNGDLDGFSQELFGYQKSNWLAFPTTMGTVLSIFIPTKIEWWYSVYNSQIFSELTNEGCPFWTCSIIFPALKFYHQNAHRYGTRICRYNFPWVWVSTYSFTGGYIPLILVIFPQKTQKSDEPSIDPPITPRQPVSTSQSPQLSLS